MTSQHETVKNTLDVVSMVAAIGSFLEMFTPIFGFIGAIWTLMRIAEMIAGKPFSEIIRRKKPDAVNK
jgi:uroporphyrinogen-III decarboxylase